MDKTKENYERDHSHVHCFESKKPPCGQRIAHLRCCLCEILNPIVTTLLEAEREKGTEHSALLLEQHHDGFKEGKRAVLQELRSVVEGKMKEARGSLVSTAIYSSYNTALTDILSEIKRLEDTL